MGCCLSTGRENAQVGSNSNNNISDASSNIPLTGSPSLINYHPNGLQVIPPRANQQPTQGAQNAPISHRTSRRQSRHLEHAAQLEEEQSGLRFDQRLTRPLVVHRWVTRTPMTREQLMRHREEFFDTRVTGRPEIWGTLRLVVESIETGDLGTAQEMLTASGITIPTGNLVHGVYDELGTRYDLPDYAVSTPQNLLTTVPEDEKHGAIISESSELDQDSHDDNGKEEMDNINHREEKGKSVVHTNAKQCKVVARLSDRGGVDIAIMFDPSEPVRVIIRKIMEKAELDPKSFKVRAVYLGRLLNEHESLSKQGWMEGNILNAMVSRIA